MNLKRSNLFLTGIFVLALVLRLISLADHSLWYDEAFAVLFSEKGVSAMVYGTLTPVDGGASDIHPLLYYTTLNLWMRIFGQSPFMVRLWSVILGMISIGLVYLIGRELFSEKTGLAAAFITGIAPFHIHYSQETRMYTLMLVLLLGVTWCCLQASRASDNQQRRWIWWGAFGVLAGLAMYTQQLSAFYLMAIGLVPFISRNRRHMIGMIVGTVIALVIYFPWMLNIPSQLEKVNSYYWIAPPGIEKFITTIYIFLTNYAEIPMPYALIALAGAITLVIFLFAQIGLYQRKMRHHSESDNNSVLFVLWLFVAPIVLMWAVSQIQPVYLERGLFTSAVMLYLLLGWIFTRSGLPRIIAILLGAVGIFLCGVGLWSQYSLNSFPYAPHHEMIKGIESQWEAGDVIVHMNKLSVLPGVYYGRELNQHYIGDAPESPEDTLAVPTQEVLKLLADTCIADASAGANRVWFVIYDRAEKEYAASTRTDLEDTFDWLETYYTADGVQQFSDINVYLYVDRQDDAPTTCES